MRNSNPMNSSRSLRRCTAACAGVMAFGAAALLIGRPVRGAAADPAVNSYGHYVTNVLRNVLESKVSSPGGNLDLEIQPTAKADQGYFSDVVISGSPVQIKHLRVTELQLHATGVRVDVPFLLANRKVNTLQSTTTLRAVVTEDDLTAMLAQGKATSTMGLKVKYIGGDQVRVAGNWQMSWFSGPIVATGRLKLVPGHKVNAEIDSLKLNGAEVPQFVKDKFMEKINPVIDYQDVPFQPKFKGLKVVGNKAILWA